MSEYINKGETVSAGRRPVKRATLHARFHAAGMRMTRQRLAIYRELERRFDHPDVEHLFKAVKPRIPQISLFTVYRTMNALESAGMVRRVATWKGHARYDGNVMTHAHFLCETCGKIDDMAGAGPDAVGVLTGLPGATVRRVDVMLSGECAACAAEHAAVSQQA